jgi:hypothetical protein
MSKSTKDDKLSIYDMRDSIIQAGIQIIPLIGSPLASIYFGIKQERRFKRLENFYLELHQEIKGLEEKLAPLEEHDEEALIAIIEEIHEKVEREHVREKINFFKTYFKNTLYLPVKENNFDERRFFLDTLASMTFLESKVLAFLFSQNQLIRIGSIRINNIDQYAIVGAINRLRSYGFLITAQGAFALGGD